MKIAASIIWIVILSFLVTACGVKAPPLPPFKEDPRFREDDKQKKEPQKESKKRKKEEKSAY